jgi:hypothetical protein
VEGVTGSRDCTHGLQSVAVDKDCFSPPAPIPGLGVDAVRYSFTVMDLHHLLLAGLPALLRLTSDRSRIGAPQRAAKGTAEVSYPRSTPWPPPPRQAPRWPAPSICAPGAPIQILTDEPSVGFKRARFFLRNHTSSGPLTTWCFGFESDEPSATPNTSSSNWRSGAARSDA